MKAKDAIKLLEQLDENQEVTLDLGGTLKPKKSGGGFSNEETIWPPYVSYLSTGHNMHAGYPWKT